MSAPTNSSAGSPAGAATMPAPRGRADRVMRQVLLLPADGPKATAAEAQKAFQTSIAVAAVRCLIMYILLPFVLPAVGIAAGVGPWIGLPIAIAAIVAVTMSIRRFWRADHSKRWHYTVIGTAVIGFMIYEGTKDLIEILG
jgi:NADH:ubiquinone oxidoreductase subunit 2 (subunit N)